jgi:predicted XRE-type DNA-binding protein
VGHVTKGNVLDDLRLDEQAALELKLKSQLHEGILALIRSHKYTARDLEAILHVQQPRVSELMCSKLSTLSVARLLLYAKRLGGDASVRVKPSHRAA